METKTIKKTIVINAPKESVWNVLLEDQYNRQWYAEFSVGTHAVTDWHQGSKVVFINETEGGIVGRIIENKPYEVLSIEYDGMVSKDGVEDLDSKVAQEMKGIKEIYLLSPEDGSIRLDVSCDMGVDYFEHMSLAWDKAMQKIKELSEKI